MAKEITWITKDKEFRKDFDTYKEALEYALDYIKNWSNNNGFGFCLTHNTSYHNRENVNRTVSIILPNGMYTYKLVISSYVKDIPTGKFETYDSCDFDIDENGKFIFTDTKVTKEIMDKKAQYFPRIERL